MIMRRLVITGALALAVVVAPAASAWASPGHDQATGTGTLGQFGDPTAHVNALETRAGLEGSFTISYPDGTFATGTDTCLVVSGSIAYVTSKITDSGGPRQQANNWFPGTYIVIGVQDNGQPGTAGPDLLNFSPGFAADPGCGPNGAATPVFPIVDGNYRVFGAR
jgi:hypothetical protein